MKRLLLILLLTTPLFGSISKTGTDCTGTSSCTPTNAIGDLQVAWATRNGSSGSNPPTVPSGWTSVGTASINGTGSADSSAVIACRVSTSANQASGTFTNAGNLLIQIYTGQKAGATAVCASSIMGSPSFFTTAPDTTSTTETFNAVTNANSNSWDVGYGFCSACTAGISTAPTGMTNRTSRTTAPGAGGHDTNAAVASFASANVTLTTAGRIITVVCEIKYQPPCGGSSSIALMGIGCR